MAFHLSAFSASIANTAALLQVAAIADQALPPINNNIVVPGQLVGPVPSISQLAAILAIGLNISAAQLQSPSLRRLYFPDIAPLNVAATPSTPLPIIDLLDDMIQLDPNEQLSAFATQGSAGAQQATILALLSDGNMPQSSGPIVPVKASGTTTLVANAWTNVPITLSQTLPVGQYQVVGMKAQSTGILAARLVFPGFVYRPGVIGTPTVQGLDWRRQRFGGMGVLGQFSSNVLPSIDVLSSSADTAETFFLDLVRISSTP